MTDDIDEQARHEPEWVAWRSRVATQVDRLFTETLLRAVGEPTASGDIVAPMPDAGRYDDAMILYWITDVFEQFFSDDDSLYAAENADIADQFVCYIGEYFVQHCGGEWANDPTVGGPLYTFGPTIGYTWTDAVDYPMDLLFNAAEQQDFSVVTDEMYARGVDYAEAHGLPHEGLELRRTFGRNT
ncbi:hypothetical protein [Nocardia terpenica]|uniref:Uncharacterized protein n=1 Tax=Nocardia terpenica TaxID=455432 RepID=A0A6G9ZER6_9NOCA|nr:hypothetical protein [Nocardia terpenica]QIS23596.1 hypothetical protein F6W96_40355 [Nocardia terpenica]